VEHTWILTKRRSWSGMTALQCMKRSRWRVDSGEARGTCSRSSFAVVGCGGSGGGGGGGGGGGNPPPDRGVLGYRYRGTAYSRSTSRRRGATPVTVDPSSNARRAASRRERDVFGRDGRCFGTTAPYRDLDLGSRSRGPAPRRAERLLPRRSRAVGRGDPSAEPDGQPPLRHGGHIRTGRLRAIPASSTRWPGPTGSAAEMTTW